MKVDVLRDLSRDEVLQKKTEIEEELFNLRLKKKTKQAQNPVRERTLRRDRARILTLLREDELGKRQLAEGSRLILDKKKE
ncbi:MAG: 50S ribosomal protein L29 [Candidatus Zixiibacteriota bacterium]|nr:MAG: 50S ribosomal protein L29 [candidate division Zixibacteria bacterium]